MHEEAFLIYGSMITQELKDAVRLEADLLKQHATAEELARLSLTSFDPSDAETCVYGLMTGDCFTKRAIELLGKCAKPYSVHNKYHQETTAKDFKGKVEKRPYSAIELYICQPKAKNKKLIAYLKGETLTLEL